MQLVFLRTGTEIMKVKLVTFAPIEDADKIRRALGDAGAGSLGEYSYCSFTTKGVGRFTPSDKANPHIGKANKPEEVQEEKIEVVCDKDNAKEIIKVLKQAHPYDEVALDIYPLLSEEDL